MNMLAIDTSNQVLGVALMQQHNIVAELSTNIKKDHSSRLMPAIVDVMEKVDMKPEALDKIVVANGPGSYTGTRIGVTTAKTMAWALHIPITTVSSLEALACNGAYFKGFICPFFDARRKTVFTGLYKWDKDNLIEVKPQVNILMEKWLSELALFNEPILFLSPNLAEFKNDISEICPTSVIPVQSAHLLRPAHLFTLGEHRETVPVHEVAPNYLRITEAEANWLKAQKDDIHHG